MRMRLFLPLCIALIAGAVAAHATPLAVQEAALYVGAPAEVRTQQPGASRDRRRLCGAKKGDTMRDAAFRWWFVLAGLTCLLAAMGPATCQQPLPEPTETVVATVDPATWAKVMDRNERHLPRYNLQVFSAPAPGEPVSWGVQRYDVENDTRGMLKYIPIIAPDYNPRTDWQCFVNEKPATMEEREGLRYLLLEGKEYGPFGEDERPYYLRRRPPAFQAVKKDGKSCLSSPGKQYGPFDELGRIADNGQRVIFWFRRGEQWYAAVDDKEFGPYDYKPAWEELRLEFSQDGKRFAFTARRPAGWYLVVDGQEYGPYELPRYHSKFPFSSDNAHFALTTRRGGQWWLLVDGKEIGPLEAEPWWEFQGPNLCYIAKQRGVFHIVLGDKEWGPYEEVEASFRPESGVGEPPRRAFRVKRGGAWYAVSRDLELGPFEEIHACGLSPDGSRLIAFATRGGKWYAVMEGREYGPYDRLVPRSSGDVVRVAFSTRGRSRCLRRVARGAVAAGRGWQGIPVGLR